MHEASIIEYSLRAVERAATAHQITQVESVTLIIGKLRIAVPDILQYSFRLLKKGTICENAILNIEEVDVVIQCNSCHKMSLITRFIEERMPLLRWNRCKSTERK